MSLETSALERLLEPLESCLTAEVADRILHLKADATVQQRLEILTERHSEGTITDAERNELEAIVQAGSLISIIQAKARSLLRRVGAASLLK